MIKRWIPRDEWESTLRALGCEPSHGTPKRASGEFWNYTDDRPYPFFVPYDEDGTMDGWALRYILQAIRGEC